MAKILSHTECENSNHGHSCPFPEHPDGCEQAYCLTCPVHCPCCSGGDDGLCNQCPEEDCGNRTMPYEPSSVSKKEE